MEVSSEVPPEAPLTEDENTWQKIHQLSRADKRHASWLRSLNLVLTFIEKKGRIPNTTEKYRGVYIGSWFWSQRDRLRTSVDRETSRLRIEALKLNGLWDVLSGNPPKICLKKWDTALSKLELYLIRYGCLPKYRDVMDEEDDPLLFGIGHWFHTKSRIAPKDRLERLELLLAKYNLSS